MGSLSNQTYYNNGNITTVSQVIGRESGVNRVVRFDFTTGENGATNIKIDVAAGAIVSMTVGENGRDLCSIPFYITTNENSTHKNANAADEGVAITGYITGSSGNKYSGSANIVLLANTKYYIWFFPPNNSYNWSFWHAIYGADHATSGDSKYSLSITAEEGSIITVNRTASPAGASTGSLSNGNDIYIDDTLKITFTPNDNYAIKTSKVNGRSFTSGNTHTVTGDVNVESDAQVLASNVGATDANIGSVSTITITKFNTNYYHSLQYSFGGISGYITNSGGIQSAATKFKETSIAFSIPESFYEQIKNSPTEECFITCKTYETASSKTQLGESTTCKFLITASEDLCKPEVSGIVIDTNSTTVALTGNNKTLIRYKSIAQCTITATPRNSASIVTKFINGEAPTNNIRTIVGVTDTSFAFTATDSRGYSNSKNVQPTIVDYIALTCNPVAYRPTPTGNKIHLTISGNMYTNSFGKYTNTLKIEYQYRQIDDSYSGWSGWKEIPTSLLIKGTSSYRSNGPIELECKEDTGFDYRYDYELHIKATDGASEHVLSTIDKYITVSRGIPIFDWGENGFAFHVPVDAAEGLNTTNLNAKSLASEDITAKNSTVENLTVTNLNISSLTSGIKALLLDCIYPIGSIYMSVVDVSPATTFGGSWERLKNRFLLGAGDLYTAGTTGGSASHPLTVDELPKNMGQFAAMRWPEDLEDGTFIKATQKATNTAYSQGTSYGTGIYTLSGGGQRHNNMPPYLVVYMWKRVS